MKKAEETPLYRLAAWTRQSPWPAATFTGLLLALTFFAIQAFHILDPWERTSSFFCCANAIIVAVVSFIVFLAHLPHPENAPNTRKQIYKWIAAWFVAAVLGVLGGGLLGIAMPTVSYATGKADTLATSSAGLERAFKLAQATFFATIIGTTGALATATIIEIIKRKSESAWPERAQEANPDSWSLQMMKRKKKNQPNRKRHRAPTRDHLRHQTGRHPAPGSGPDRHQDRVRRWTMRFVRRPAGWQGGALLCLSRPPRRRQEGAHRRGAGRQSWGEPDTCTRCKRPSSSTARCSAAFARPAC